MASKAELKTVISADMSGFAATMRRASAVSKTTGGAIARGIGRATGSLKAMSVAAVASAGSLIAGALAARKFYDGLKGAADLGGKMSDLAAQTGISAGNMLILSSAFERSGISGENSRLAINKLQKTLVAAGDGSKGAQKAFADLGLYFENLRKMSPVQQFEAVGGAIANIKDPAERAARSMAIFGKSGAELQTLFTDRGAFSGAAKSLGKQAEIIDRRANDFDNISDMLGRTGAKMQGFFVGMLDRIAEPVIAILERFDSLDLAEMGQSFGDAIKDAAPFVLQMAENAFQFGQNLIKGINLAREAMKAVFSPDFWKAVGLYLKAAFLDAVNVLTRGIMGVMSAIPAALVETGNVLASLFMEIMKPSFWKGLLNTLSGIALSFASKLMDAMVSLIAKVESIPVVGKYFKGASDALSSASKDLAERGSAMFKKGSEDLGPAIQKAVDGAQSIGSAAAGGFKRGSAGAPQFDTSGMKDAASALVSPFANAMMDTLKKPNLKLRDLLPQAPVAAVESPANAIPRGFGSNRAPLGTDNIFAKDRERLGIASGLGSGGLGEKRRLKTSKDDKDEKKKLSLEERSVDTLESINGKISQALTVG